jgi:hypothetical protein
LIVQMLGERLLAAERGLEIVGCPLERAARAGAGPIHRAADVGGGLGRVAGGAFAGRGLVIGGVQVGASFRIGRNFRRGLRGVGLALRLVVAFVARQQRIAFELGLDKRLELEIRQLQQLDRLLQLRRDDQSLALPKL